MEKLTTYWRVRSADDPDAKPVWEKMSTPPPTQAGLVGDLRIENNDQVMLIYFVDTKARDSVTRAARDAAALAQEWEIPHRPAQRRES